MSEFVVGKPFNTVNRRFKPDPDAVVTPEDVADGTLGWDELIERKFLVEKPTTAPAALPPVMPVAEDRTD